MDIKIVGNLLSESFYTSKFILFNLVKHRPDLVNKYLIKGVLDIEWTICLWKLNQILGGMRRQDSVAIFINKMYVGTDVEFQGYLNTKYNFTINLWVLNYKQLMCDAIQNYYSNDKQSYVRMIFHVNDWKIGNVVFALFDELVPETCKYFKELCLDKTKGYLNSIVHRIDTSNGFIQAGRNSNQLAYIEKENYKMNHDRRGVLSLAGKYEFHNGPEFIVSLQPNPWMNNKYVAFGQAVEGEQTLRTIEKLFDSGALADDRDGGGPARVRITSCDVLFVKCIDDALASTAARKGLDDFLRSLVRGSVRKAMYVNVYGKPERFHSPFAADRLYVKSIVGIIMREVMRKIDAPRREPTATALRPSVNGCSRSSGSTSSSDSSVWSSWDSAGTFDDLGPVTKLIPHPIVRSSIDDSGRDEIGNRVGFPILSRREPTTTAPRPSTSVHGVRLPENHKDYWKFKKIYESIAK